MTFETKEEVLEKILEEEKPKCPHCNEGMTLWEVPPINFSDGLGWGVPYLYVCFNDACSLYVQGWDNLKENYAHNASYRCICYPGKEQFECMPVFSPMGGQGQIIDQQSVFAEEALKASIKKGFSMLADCYVAKDPVPVLNMVMDPTQPIRVRVKAAEIVGDIGELEVIEPLRSIKPGNELFKNAIAKAIQTVHERFFTKECPYCAEVIKKRANVCKHCSKDLTT